MLINKIYDILEKHEIGCDIYNPEAVKEIKQAIVEAGVPFEYDFNVWENMNCFTAAFAISYHGAAKLVMFDCEYNW